MNFDEISEEDLRNGYNAVKFEDKSTMSDVVDRWNRLTDNRSTQFLWDALDQLYLNERLEAEEYGDQMVLTTDIVESFDELEYREPEKVCKIKKDVLEIDHQDSPILPASIMYDHFDRSAEIDALPYTPETDRVAAEKEGPVKLRYVVENDFEDGQDRVHLRGFFHDTFWTERHHQRYLEDIEESEITSLVNRSRRIQDAAEEGLEKLEEMDRSLEGELERLSRKADRFNPEARNHIEAFADAYYSKDFDGGTEFMKPYAQAMEIEESGEGDIGQGETFGDTLTAEDRREAGKQWLEFYLDILWEEAKK